MLRFILFPILFGILSTGFSQIIGSDEIDPAKIAQWKTKNKENYEGVYRFGFSEDESELIILVEGELITAQLRSGSFEVVNGKTKWVAKYRNLTQVRILGNLFFSDQYAGSFVVFEPNDEPLWALRIDNPWSGMVDGDQYELGMKAEKMENSFPGEYHFASTRLLESSEMNQYSKTELKIMRNEIFARYGHVFIKGGAMETHFKKQDWYSPKSKDVTKSVTDIEKKNIALIRKWETK